MVKTILSVRKSAMATLALLLVCALCVPALGCSKSSDADSKSQSSAVKEQIAKKSSAKEQSDDPSDSEDEPQATAAASEAPATEDEADVEEESSAGEEAVEPEDVSAAAEGLRPEIKEAIDSYEAFFDEYCDFMAKYSSSDDTISMLADYADFMQQYADTMEKLQAMEDQDLTDEETIYYVDAMARINQKLLETSASME